MNDGKHRKFRKRAWRKILLFRRKTRGLVLTYPFLALLVGVAVLALLYLPIARGVQLPSRVGSVVDSIFAGVVASLCTFSLLQFFVAQRRHKSIRRWLRVGRRRLWVIPTMMKHPTESRYQPWDYYVVPPFDAQAASVLSEVFRQAHYRFPYRSTKGSHILDEKILQDNLALICLPQRNQYTRVFLGLFYEIYCKGAHVEDVTKKENWRRYIEDTECTLQYFGVRLQESSNERRHWRILHFEEDPPNEWLTSSINEYGPASAKEAESAVDVAMILKAPNPFNVSSSVLVVCGIHGIGTLGGALWVYKESRFLADRFGHKPQAHVVRVRYTIDNEGTSYEDATILEPIRLISSKELTATRDQ